MEELDATEDAIFERTASLIGRSTDADAIHALSQLSKPTLLPTCKQGEGKHGCAACE